jgi:hypothetical protein
MHLFGKCARPANSSPAIENTPPRNPSAVCFVWERYVEILEGSTLLVMGNNVTMRAGVTGIDHNGDDGGRVFEGAESEFITLSLQKVSHCVEIIHVQSHAEEAQLLNHVVAHQIHVVSVRVNQNVVLHKLGAEMMSHLQIEALGQNLNTKLGVFAGEYGIARRYHSTVLLLFLLKMLFTEARNRAKFAGFRPQHTQYTIPSVTKVLQIRGKMKKF